MESIHYSMTGMQGRNEEYSSLFIYLKRGMKMEMLVDDFEATCEQRTTNHIADVGDDAGPEACLAVRRRVLRRRDQGRRVDGLFAEDQSVPFVSSFRIAP